MRVNLHALKALIDTDPANATKTDAQVISWLKEVDPSPSFRSVPWLDLALWIATVDGMQRIDDAANDATKKVGVRSAARLLASIVNAGQDLPLDDIRARTALGKLTPDVFTGAEVVSLNNISKGAPRRVNAAGLTWPQMDSQSELYWIAQVRSV